MSTKENATERADRDEHGRFVKGHSIKSPGRPPGSIDFYKVCKDVAKQYDMTLDELLAGIVRSLFKRGFSGDLKAIQIVLNRLCGPIITKNSSDVEVIVGVDARTGGPPIPTGPELDEYVKQLHEAAAEVLDTDFTEIGDD